MMFKDDGRGEGVLAISQPAHAWIAGQLLRAWAAPLDAMLLLAAEQHDLAWLDWERSPTFDPNTGRPHLFRDVGAAEHSPLWTLAVQRAEAAWGARVALMISRHGGVIYTRFVDRHRTAAADAAAASRYLADQAPSQAAWAAALGLGAAELERDSDLIAFADTLSLALCGALPAPLVLTGPGVRAGSAEYRLAASGEGYTLSPWPFLPQTLAIEVEGRWLPGGRLADEAAMRRWLLDAARRPMRVALHPAGTGR